MNYASTANIEEVMKFYNLGHKTFERDFSDTNSPYVRCTKSFDDILRTHANFVNSVGLVMSEEDKNFPYLYWIPKLHKTPFKHRFILAPVNAQLKTYHASLKSYYLPLEMD